MHWYDGWHMGWGMMIWWIIAILLIVGAVWWLASQSRRSSGPGGPGGPGAPNAEEELKRRYARGEIDREQYERMLEDLRK